MEDINDVTSKLHQQWYAIYRAIFEEKEERYSFHDLENLLQVAIASDLKDDAKLELLAQYIRVLKPILEKLFISDLDDLSYTCTKNKLSEVVELLEQFPIKIVDFKHVYVMFRECCEFEYKAEQLLGQPINNSKEYKAKLEKTLNIKSNIRNILIPSYFTLCDRLELVNELGAAPPIPEEVEEIKEVEEVPENEEVKEVEKS